LNRPENRLELGEGTVEECFNFDGNCAREKRVLSAQCPLPTCPNTSSERSRKLTIDTDVDLNAATSDFLHSLVLELVVREQQGCIKMSF
jgi:hypothetical protein